MDEKIYIEYPESLANALKLNGKEFTSEMKTSSLVKLYELGKVSSGMAAKVLGISRLTFLELLAQYKVSIFEGYDSEDIDEDIVNA
jgi:predicted HTH domain antitoxin